jgi:hypothetical protein
MTKANLDEMFGTTPRDAFEDAETAEGYQVGQLACVTLHAAIQTDHGHRSKAFREAVLEGLRDNI